MTNAEDRGWVTHAPLRHASPKELRITLSALVAVTVVTLVVALAGWGWMGVLSVTIPLMFVGAATQALLGPR